MSMPKAGKQRLATVKVWPDFPLQKSYFSQNLLFLKLGKCHEMHVLEISIIVEMADSTLHNKNTFKLKKNVHHLVHFFTFYDHLD